jgi:hypothetical protein
MDFGGGFSDEIDDDLAQCGEERVQKIRLSLSSTGGSPYL